ncbi:hypothetical protein BJX61DRAFT_194937 [Aspergillus egyptiacus]|nr:hypothetical protein BJX61DRAFT_194937 [Aspergillus egyptiacus]
MSRPFLSSAARRFSRPCPARATSPVPSSLSAPSSHASRRTLAIQTTPKRTSRVRSIFPQYQPSCLNTAEPRSPFSSSAANRAARVTQNPRTGEDGNTLMIDISPRAANVRSASPAPLCACFCSLVWLVCCVSGMHTHTSMWVWQGCGWLAGWR